MSLPAPARARVPLVTAAAGCGGTGRELARFGDLAALDAVHIGPVGPPGPSGGHTGPAELVPTPSGLVHTPAAVWPVERVTEEVLPWLRARGLRAVCAIRGSTVADVADTARRLRRSLDGDVLAAVEIDLSTPREPTRTVVGGSDETEPARPLSADPQVCLKLLSAVREQLPRDLLLLAKIGGECPDPVAAARAAVGGGARGLLLSGGLPALQEGRWLSGPAVAPLTLGLLRRLSRAVAEVRVPDVPLVAVGGIHDVPSARAALAAGAAGLQVGTGLLSDPWLLWRLQEALRETTPASTTAATTAPVDPDAQEGPA